MQFNFKTICSICALFYAGGGVFAVESNVLIGDNQSSVLSKVVIDDMQRNEEQNSVVEEVVDEDAFLLSNDDDKASNDDKDASLIIIDDRFMTVDNSSQLYHGQYVCIDKEVSLGELLSLWLPKNDTSEFMRVAIEYVSQADKVDPNEYGVDQVRSFISNDRDSMWSQIARECQTYIAIYKVLDNTMCELFEYGQNYNRKKILCYKSDRYWELQRIIGLVNHDDNNFIEKSYIQANLENDGSTDNELAKKSKQPLKESDDIVLQNVLKKNEDKEHNRPKIKTVINQINKINLQTILNQAIKYEDIELIEYVINNYKDIVEIDACDAKGDTALMIAIKDGNIKMVRYLVEHGVDINKSVKHGKTALEIAMGYHNHEICKFLLDQSDINIESKHLCLAISNKMVDIVLRLIAKGVSLNAMNREGYTPLMIASKCGYMGCVKALVDKADDIVRRIIDILLARKNNMSLPKTAYQCCDVNVKNKEGQTAFSLAINNYYYEIAVLLLSKGVKINTQSNDYKILLNTAIPLGYCNLSSKFVLFKKLLSKVNNTYFEENIELGVKLLESVMDKENIDVLRLLMKKGIKIPTEQYGTNSMYQNLLWIQQALNDKEKINLPNNKGKTAVQIVCEKFERPEHLNELLYALSKQGADFKVIDDFGETLLFKLTDHPKLINWLVLNKKVDVNHKNNAGKTLLKAAIEKGDNATIEQVLAMSQTDLNEEDGAGHTALYFALRENRERIAGLLISKGANIANKLGVIPYCDTTSVDMARLLVDRGWDINAALRWGMIRADCNKPEYLDFLVSIMDKVTDMSVVRECITYGYVQRLFGNVVLNLNGVAETKLLTSNKDTPLMKVLKSSMVSNLPVIREKLVKALVEHGADLNMCDNDGDYPITYAEELSEYLLRRVYMSNKISCIYHKNSHGYNLIISAMLIGSSISDSKLVAIIQSIFNYIDKYEQDAKDIKDDLLNKPCEGLYPIHLAVRNNYYNLLKLLIKHGANIHVKDEGGASPFEIAVQKNNVKCVWELLRTSKIKLEEVANVADKYNNLFIWYNWLIREQNKGDNYIVFTSAAKNDTKTLQLLMKQEVDVSVKNSIGKSALDIAVMNNSIKYTNKLIKSKQFTPQEIFRAILRSDLEDIKNFDIQEIILLEKKYGLDLLCTWQQVERDKNGVDCLIRAVEKDDIDMLELLIEDGANVNIENSEGKSALRVAVEKGYTQCEQKLLKSLKVDVEEIVRVAEKYPVVIRDWLTIKEIPCDAKVKALKFATDNKLLDIITRLVYNIFQDNSAFQEHKERNASAFDSSDRTSDE